ncbi:MAG: cyclic nucleotide-binding domain-containing protein [Gammaproteobacteria bacterium]|uniref:N-acyl amino acid synthase FeeM domain-containing protein n=1 Tax=Pseudomaricurvus alcaniphilus TaxID=1166482 RepID=UPI00140756DF|nr:cyclic nucleotide-binding domain-containing protein [Gammaproteobacteria bacterium]NHN36747.1 cyclic nucleotide-binding domain-containing protein [Pseudomaricurvus alcaniphilus]
MAIRIKVASTARELDDVYRLRHEVYVEEKRRFESSSHLDSGQRITDKFDAMPGVYNIVAYAGDEIIGALRINKDSEVGLPAEQYFDYSALRRRTLEEHQQENAAHRGTPPCIVGVGMLAISRDWRNRRNVLYSIFKSGIGLIHTLDGTHIICSISAETLSLYGRLGFEQLGGPKWVESVHDHMIPLVANFDTVFQWAFGEISKKVDHFWLDNFCGQFERVLLSPGEVLFEQNDAAEHAYAVDEGLISISRKDPESNEMVLANLSCGALFGELAIFDGEKRSAKATALVNTELISIERSQMFDSLKAHPENLVQLLRHFAQRVRETDNLAMVQAFAAHTSKVSFALEKLWQTAEPDRKNPEWRTVKIGPAQLAKTANVTEDEVRQDLEMRQAQGLLQYGEKIIRFMQEPSEGSVLRVSNESPL